MDIRVIGSADMNSKNFSASFLINGNILLDIPGGTLRELRRMDLDPMDVETVLITHNHGDHVLDLPLWVLQKSKLETEGEEKTPKVAAGPDTAKLLDGLVQMSFATSFTPEKKAKYLGFIIREEFSLGKLKIRRVPVRHGKLSDCCGYRITDGKVTVGFTGDSCLCSGVEMLAKECDVLFADCDLVKGNEKHMGINDLLSLKERYPKLRIIATHLKDETRGKLREQAPEGIEIARDGMKIEL